MGCNSYLDLMREIYTTDDDFHDYVDHWCKLTHLGRLSAFMNQDVQRKAQDILKRQSQEHRLKIHSFNRTK